MWLDKVLDVAVNAHSVDDNVSWSAYHALQCTEAAGMNSVNALLPLFHESAKTVAMIRHSLKVINQAVQHTNPLVKEIQSLLPDTYVSSLYL